MKDKLISEHRFVEDLYGCLDGFDFDLEDVLNVLKGVEPVDAVQVVRCKHCAVPHNYSTGCPKLGGLIPPEDFYCACGKRKDNEHDTTC